MAAAALNVLWGGKYDYQRPWGQPFGHINSSQIAAANFGVGVYFRGAGFTIGEMDTWGKRVFGADRALGGIPAEREAYDLELWELGYGFAVEFCK